MSQKQETETKREPAPKPKAETTAGGTAFIAADLMLVAAFLMSALFCVCTAFIDDGRVNVVINDDGKEIACDAWPSSVGELLAKNDIEVYEHDEISCALDDEITDGMTIKITRAFPIAVESQNDVVIVKMTKGTVGEALALAGVEYDADDEISELTFADIEPGMRITHTNVEIDYKTSYEELEFNEVTVKDSSMYKGQSKVVVEGENGEKLITRRITYKNGYQFSREIVDQVILKQAVDQVTNIGSKTRYQTSYAGEWREYKEPPTAGKNGWVEMTVDYITAYTGDGITAKGTVPKLGTIAVTPQYIPYYSQIYVKNYGYGTALDTGAFRNRFENGKRVNQLDLFFNTESECRRWGRKRNVTVLVKLNK
ncbi:MAG: G5 domain-containing protein [Clostridia bacterium]|nr:G5 domain-containing protein [Clostridia bacterium]